MENREIAIKLSGVKKMYKLGQIGGGTLTADLQSWWARIRGKEDPNTTIGTDKRLVGQTFMALNGIDLTVYKGEALGIIGGNGAGKSTMLKLLSRVTAPTDGEIDIYGRIASMLEVGTGFNGDMTGRENVYMNGAILGMTKAEIDAKMDDIIEFSEVGDFIDTPVKRYSSGMYVKLAFSVAAHLDSEIMIMDEVLAVGDMAFQKKCLDKMRSAAKEQGRTVLYVSHNMNTIRQLCDRCVVLDEGKVVFEGKVEEAISVYTKKDLQEIKSDIDLTPKKHNSSYPGCRMTRFQFVEGSTPWMKPGETITFQLTIKSKITCENMRFRCMFFSNDGSPIAMATSMVGNMSISPGDCVFNGIIHTENLAPGSYWLRFALYTNDDVRGEQLYDVINRAVCFQIINIGYDIHVSWNSSKWGHISLNNISFTRQQ